MQNNLEVYGFRKDYNPEKRIVKQEYITYNNKIYYVSTIDLGKDYSFGFGNPLYYETMIFNIQHNRVLYCVRYETRDEAQKGHDEIIKSINENKVELINGYFEKISI